MEDVLTDIPPPSRFFFEDLDNFTSSSPFPSPFFSFSDACPSKPLHPSLLIIALSSPSLHFFQHVSSKTLIGNLVLPETSFSGNSIEPSPKNRICDLYIFNDPNRVIIVVCFQRQIASERAHAVAKLLIGEQIIPERVLIFDSIQSRNFRGRLPPDETFAFKLETSPERKAARDGFTPLLKGLDYFPSGSVIEGLAAALLSRCQMKKIKATLCVSWPVYGRSVSSLVEALLLQNVLAGLEYNINPNKEDAFSTSAQKKDHPIYSDLYT